MIPSEVRLYSWVDVEDVLIRAQHECEWPEWLVWARAYWDSLTLGLRPGNEEHAKEWLSDKFDPRFDKETDSILLESLPGKPRKLVVKFEDTQKEPKGRFLPSFGRPTVIWKPQEYDHPAPLPPDTPPLVIFHSFKGGVGRTVHAISLALYIVKRQKRVLLIDGDIEAPGISWLLRNRMPSPQLSFVDFIALIHGDPDPSGSYSIELAADKLKDSLIDDNLYVMPAFRSMSQFNSVEIKPEHLVLGSENPFILTEMLIELGKALKVDTIIVDLRAGISEISAGLLLDPRVFRVLVTTISSQSFEGTRLLLELIAGLAPSKKEEEPLPAIILSQIPEEFQDEEKIDSYLELLWASAKKSWKLENEHLFSWSEIPGKDNQRLIDFLIRKFGINWAKAAKIEKIDNDNTIIGFTEKNSFSIKINDKKTEIELEIDDGRTDEFIAKMESDKLNIYESENEDDKDFPIQFATAFDSNLVVLPESWDEVAKRIMRSDLFEKMGNLMQWLPEMSSRATSISNQFSDLDDLKRRRRELSHYAEQLVYAEKGKIGEFLRIRPLQNLALDFRANVPIAVIVGAKGSGKTYTFLQMARRQNWESFANDSGVKDVSIHAYICPIFYSKNLEEPARRIVAESKRNSLMGLGLTGSFNSQDIIDYVGASLKENLHVGEWRDRWLNILAWSSGFKIGDNNAGRAFPGYLREMKIHVVAIIDGLEDLFQYILNDRDDQTAVRALLQDVPEWLEQQPSRPMGLLIFIRHDMVLSAVRQNPAQLIARYDRYALKWSSEEALRLASWIASKAKALDNPTLETQVESMDSLDLTNELVKLWGRKLGGERSREARSADWVIATLTVGGQIQARDLVRLLFMAAKASISDAYWRERILAPNAIRESIKECSIEKIDDTKIENESLKNIFSEIDKLPSIQKIVPFKREDIALNTDQIQTLVGYGVLIRDEENYYIPEIFRLGLGFKLRKGARPRALYLARRAQKWNE